MADTIQVWKISQGGTSYYGEDVSFLVDEIQECATGDKFEIEKVEMNREEFEKLPEFTGF